jgi:predicted permease
MERVILLTHMCSMGHRPQHGLNGPWRPCNTRFLPPQLDHSRPRLQQHDLSSPSLDLSTILPDGDVSGAIDRAESYFLINAMVSNSLTFALGPRLLKPSDEDAPDVDKNGEEADEGTEDGSGDEDDMERGPDGIIDEETTLLPQQRVRDANHAGRKGYRAGKKYWDRLPPWSQEVLDIIYQFANAPLIGACLGAFIGLIPPFHRAFFNQANEGGWLNASLTTSIKNIGELFASTQIIVVGVKLSQSLRKMKRGEESGPISKTSLAFVAITRFIVWPVYVFLLLTLHFCI